MNRTEREQFLAERLTGIGGSDVASLWSLEPYGCRRRLWYEKVQAVPDFQRVTNPDMERGTHLEKIVCKLYARETGRMLTLGGFWRHETDKHLIVHPDRRIDLPDSRHGESPGLLEVKCPTVRVFLKVKREGLLDSWLLQLQHGLGITGFGWGAFAIFSAELWEQVRFDVKADPHVFAKIREEGKSFWNEVTSGSPPERLAPDDNRCARCAYRTQCQGEALRAAARQDGGGLTTDDSLGPVVRDFLQAKEMATEADILVEAARARLERELGDRQTVQADGCKVYFRVGERVTLNTGKLRQDHPELAKVYEQRSITRTLRVYPPD